MLLPAIRFSRPSRVRVLTWLALLDARWRRIACVLPQESRKPLHLPKSLVGQLGVGLRCRHRSVSTDDNVGNARRDTVRYRLPSHRGQRQRQTKQDDDHYEPPSLNLKTVEIVLDEEADEAKACQPSPPINELSHSPSSSAPASPLLASSLRRPPAAPAVSSNPPSTSLLL